MRHDPSAPSRLRAALRRVEPDAGFTLVEVVVAMVLLTMVATAAFMLFVRVLQSSKGMDSRSAAITVAQQAMDQARSVTASFDANFHSGMVDGRSQAAVTAQFASPPVGVDLSQTYPDYDPAATGASTPVIPLSGTSTVSNQTFNVTTFVGQCVLTKSTGVCNKTIAGSTPPATTSLTAGQTLVERVIVSVTWTNANSCATAAACSYTVATLIDPAANPQFQVYILRANDDIFSATCSMASPPTYNCLTELPVLLNDQGKFGVNGIAIAAAPAHGVLNLNLGGGNPAISYKPTDCTATTPAFSGVDTFTYHATDIHGDVTNDAKVTVTVIPPAAPTLGSTTVGGSVAASASGSSVTIPAVPAGSVAGWCSLSNAVTGLTVTSTNPTGASVPLTLSGVGAASAIKAAVPAGWSGVVNFTYTLSDAFGQPSPMLTGQLVVTPTAPAVTAAVNENVTALDTNKATATLLGVGSSLTYSLATTPAHGTATLVGSTLTYVPAVGWPGGVTSQTDTFSYRATDAAGQTVVNSVTVTVVPPPIPKPIATSFKLTTCQSKNTTGTYDFGSSPYNAYVSFPAGQGSPPLSATVGTVSGSSVTSVTGLVVKFKLGGTSGTGKTLFTFQLTDPYGQTSGTASVTC